MYIASQVLVCLADVLYIISMLTKKKISLVMFLFFSDILFATHYFLLDGGLTGAATIMVDVVYLVVMYVLEKYNKTKYNLLTTIIAMIITVVLSIVTWQGAISIMPMMSMLIYLTTMIFTNVIIVKSGALTRNLINIIYMFIIHSWFGGGLEIVLMLSAVVGIIINYKNSKNNLKNGEVKKDQANNPQTNSVQENNNELTDENR